MSGRIPVTASWFSSPEPKALATAMRMTDTEVAVVDALREQERGITPWFAQQQWRDLIGRALAQPRVPAFPGWEPIAATRDRVVPAGRRILADHSGEEIVLVGHGTAWAVLEAELTGESVDLDAWETFTMPDVWIVDLAESGQDRPYGRNSHQARRPYSAHDHPYGRN